MAEYGETKYTKVEYTAESFYQLLKEKNINPDSIQQLLVETLIEKNKKVATAESCTGGLLSKRITEISGASSVFDCGICSYANEIKHKLLNVKNETLEAFGAVSPQTAVQMAEGVRKLAKADYGISTTGIAGPTGGTKEKPVGLVFIGISSQKSTYAIRTLLGDEGRNTRENIRKIASDIALFSLLAEIAK
ncbi:MAG: CinA family protein [Ruminococcus sp.]